MALFLVIGFPLTVSSVSIGRDTARESRVRTAASAWGDEIGWELLDVITADSRVTVRMIGPPPLPDPHGLRSHLQAQRVDPSVVIAEFIPKTTVDLADDADEPPAEAASAVELEEHGKPGQLGGVRSGCRGLSSRARSAPAPIV